MKKILTFLTFMLLSLTTLFAQSNDKISYQAVVRNNANQLVVNSQVNVTIAVANSQGGEAVYKETHTVTTNANGLMSLLVGEGTVVSGNWSDINWSSAYVTSTMTVDGVELTHTVPVNAVPYALYADQVNPQQVANAVDQVLPQALQQALGNNYVTNDDLQEAIDGIEFPQADWTAVQGPGVILNKPEILTPDDLSGALEDLREELEETLADFATKQELRDDSTALAQKLNDTIAYFKNRALFYIHQVPGFENVPSLSAAADMAIPMVAPLMQLLASLPNTLQNLQNGIANNRQAIIDTAANIRNSINNATLTLKQGENTLGTFTADANQDVEIDIPSIDLTAKDLENFIDTVSLPTALSVYGHVHDSLKPQIKEGLKLFVAQTVKNNPTYAMDILTHYIKSLTQDQVSQIFGAYNQMDDEAQGDLLNGLAQIIKDNPDIAYDVLNHYIDNVDVPRALSVLPHIDTMDNGVKTGLKIWVAQVAKNNPTYVMDILTHYIENLTPAQVSEIFGAYDEMDAQAKSEFRDNMLEILDIPTPEDQVQADWAETNTDSKAFILNKPTIPEAANEGTVTLWQGTQNNVLATFNVNTNENLNFEIPATDSKITTAKINEFIDNVEWDTAMLVFPHVQGMDSQVKEGLKTWVAQVVKNNPTKAMDVLTHYIKSLTVDQVGQIVGAYNQMNNTSKDSVLKVVAKIIKDNPDIAYDVLIHYIDNVTVAQALPVYQHIHNNMNADVKEGLKLFVEQTVKNNPAYVMRVLNYYLGLGNNPASADVQQQVNAAVQQYAAKNKDLAKTIVCNYLSTGTAEDVDALVTALASNNAGGKEQFKTILDAYIDRRIPAAATETSKKFTATAGQTSFTLDNVPKSNYLVRMYINGVMVGDSATGVVTVTGNTVTYVDSENDNKALAEGDIVIISYFK